MNGVRQTRQRLGWKVARPYATTWAERWGWFCAIFLATLLTLVLFSGLSPVQAQSAPVEAVDEAAVVVDGKVIFTVKDTKTLTASARAKHINEELVREVRSPTLANIRAVEEHRRNLVYLKSQASDDILITVTDGDVTIIGGEPIEQARDWAEQLETALRQGQLERQPRYLRKAAIYGVAALGGAIALHLAFQCCARIGYRRLDRWFDYISNPFTEWEKPLKLFWQLGAFGIKAGIWVTVLFYITEIFPQARIWRYDVINLLTSELVPVGDGGFSALDLLGIVLFTIALWFVSNAIASLSRAYIFSQARLTEQVQELFTILVRYTLIFLGIVILIQRSGVDISSLTIVASALGVGIGFGLQNITNNFISGFIILLERPIQTGDFINVRDLVGTVTKIGARSTEIRTPDQVTIIVPNARFLESEVINWSHGGNSVSRLHIPVGVAYGSDIPLVKQVLLDAVRQHPEVLFRPRPEVFFQGFEDSALKFEILVWMGEPREQFRVKSDLNYEIEASLRRHGIQIPFPQRDLHVRSPQLEDLVSLLKHSLVGTHNGHAPSNGTTAVSTKIEPQAAEVESAVESAESPVNTASQVVKKTHKTLTIDKGDQTSGVESGPESGADAIAKPPVTSPGGQTEDKQTAHHSQLSSDLDLETLAKAMQGPEGVEIRDRHYCSRRYPACFTGTDAVEWLVQQRDYTREDAILIGQWLLQQGFIHRIIDNQEFEDGYHFYQFYKPGQPVENTSSPTDKAHGI